MFTNDKTKQVTAGKLKIGGDAPVSIQSMLNVRADNIEGNVNQAKAQIAKHDLSARKAAVRTAVKVKTAKATPAVVEMPIASNF